MPSEVEIIGSPSLKFAANVDFGKYFSDMTDDVVNDDSDSRKVLRCTNPSLEYLAFVLRMEIFSKDDYTCETDLDEFLPGETGNINIDGIDIPVEYQVIDGDRKFFVLANDEVIKESDEPYILTFQGIEDYLKGFEFTGVKAKIYISGSELADVISIDLFRVIEETETLLVEGDIPKGASGIENLEEYTEPDLPPGGAPIDISDIINHGGDLCIKYKIYLPEGAVINREWLSWQHKVVAEIVIWLPMTFESVEEDAHFLFPDSFDEIGDVIKSLAETDSIEDMNIKISISPLNPFGNGLFIIKDDGYGNIPPCPLDEHNFFIKFNKEDLNYINNNPFDPQFSVSYPAIGSKLEIPKGDIMITTVSLDAKLKYNMEL